MEVTNVEKSQLKQWFLENKVSKEVLEYMVQTGEIDLSDYIEIVFK